MQSTRHNITIVLTPLIMSACIFINAIGMPQSVYGQEPVIDAANLNVNTTSAISSSLMEAYDKVSTELWSAFTLKEFSLDAIAWELSRIALLQMSRSTINWINSGFEGSPAFITDFEGFLIDTADEIAGEFIYGSELNFLCSPFALDVRIALGLNYAAQDYEPRCTLSEVVDNVNGFFQEGFAGGNGYPAWFQISKNSRNTPLGSYLDAQVELSGRINETQQRDIQELLGNGFFKNYELCDIAESPTGGKKNCLSVLPGSTIANQLEVSLDSGREKLLTANEINEVVGALFAQLGQQALTGGAGLLGLGGSGYSKRSFGTSGNLSYLDALEEDAAQRPRDPVFDDFNQRQNPIARSIVAAESYMDSQGRVVLRVTDVENLRQAFIDDFTETDQETGEEVVTCTFSSVPSSLVRTKADAVRAINETTASVQALEIMNDEYINAQTAQEEAELLDAYMELNQSGLLKTEVDAKRVDLNLSLVLEKQISDYTTALNQRATQCISRGDQGR